MRWQRVRRPLDLWREDLLHRLMEREQETSTVISPGLAIPHVIVPDHHEMMIVRCRWASCSGHRNPRARRVRASPSHATTRLPPASPGPWQG